MLNEISGQMPDLKPVGYAVRIVFNSTKQK